MILKRGKSRGLNLNLYTLQPALSKSRTYLSALFEGLIYKKQKPEMMIKSINEMIASKIILFQIRYKNCIFKLTKKTNKRIQIIYSFIEYNNMNLNFVRIYWELKFMKHIYIYIYLLYYFNQKISAIYYVQISINKYQLIKNIKQYMIDINHKSTQQQSNPITNNQISITQPSIINNNVLNTNHKTIPGSGIKLKLNVPSRKVIPQQLGLLAIGDNQNNNGNKQGKIIISNDNDNELLATSIHTSTSNQSQQQHNNIQSNHTSTHNSLLLSKSSTFLIPNLTQLPSTPLLPIYQTFDKFHQKYQIKQKIGQGTSGIVYKCLKKDNGGIYIVKRTRYQIQHISTMKRSYNTIKMLNHQNIIKYKSMYISSAQNKAYLIMQYFPHPNLNTFKFLPQNQQELQNIIYQLLDAISYMHQIGLCHRDIKPDNILYDRQKQQIKIIDFGVSREIGVGKLKKVMMTRTGTAQYKAPELFQGGQYDQLVDQWAAGISLYKLIAGVTPFYQSFSIKQTLQNLQKCVLTFQQPIWNQYTNLVKQLLRSLISPHSTRITAQQAKKSLWFKQGHKQLYQSSNIINKIKYQQLSLYQSFTGIDKNYVHRAAQMRNLKTQAVSGKEFMDSDCFISDSDHNQGQIQDDEDEKNINISISNNSTDSKYNNSTDSKYQSTLKQKTKLQNNHNKCIQIIKQQEKIQQQSNQIDQQMQITDTNHLSCQSKQQQQ